LTRIDQTELDREFQIDIQPKARSAPPRLSRSGPLPLARALLRLIANYPGLALGVSEEQMKLLDGDDMAATAALVDMIQNAGPTTPSMLIELARQSQYAEIYAAAMSEDLTLVID